jgi:hypothetical protein
MAGDAAARPTAHQLMDVLANLLGCHIENELNFSRQSSSDNLVPQSSTADVLHSPVGPKRETLNLKSDILEEYSVSMQLSCSNAAVPNLGTAAAAHDEDLNETSGRGLADSS